MNETWNQHMVVSPLNRLLRILTRSLARYVEEARPWTGTDDLSFQDELARMVADHEMLGGRIANSIIQNGGQPEPGPFPIEFTGLNDCGLDYLLRKIVERLRLDIEVANRCVAELAPVPDVQSLAEEVLGNLQGHLDVLKGRSTVGIACSAEGSQIRFTLPLGEG